MPRTYPKRRPKYDSTRLNPGAKKRIASICKARSRLDGRPVYAPEVIDMLLNHFDKTVSGHEMEEPLRQ